MKNKSNSTAKEFLCVALLSAMTFLATANAFAADGDLDSTFGTGGKIITDFNNLLDQANGIAVQTDGRIVVVGSVIAPSLGSDRGHFGVARYNANGSLDTTFDGDGKVITPFGIGAIARAVAIQADGKIVVVGLCRPLNQSDFDFGIARYNTNGSLDTTFNSTGIIVLRFSTFDDDALAVAIQADGKIVVAGDTPTSEVGGSQLFALARFNPNGALDSTFDADGKVTTAFAVSAGAKSVVAQSNGHIVAAGGSSLARYQSSGALDDSFGTSGRVFISSVGIRAAAIQTDGKIVVTGSNGDFTLTRLTSAGFFDTTFGTNGRVTTDFGSTTEQSTGIAIQSDGKIVTVGQSGVTANSHFAIARHNVNGSLDTSFSDDGKVLTQIVPNVEASASAVAIQSDGKIVVAGRTGNLGPTNDFAVVRYQSGGAVIAPRPHRFDFDGDGRDDLAVYRPAVGTWFVQRSQASFFNQQFGTGEDIIAPADYDGDGKTDIAVFRPSTGIWFRINSLNNQFNATAFGQSGDLPRPGDYDGDGKADIAVFRPSNGTWYLLRSQAGFVGIQFGTSGDLPLPADYDGDGRTEVAVYRPSTGTWFTSLNPATNYGAVQFGLPSDKPVPADYDGDGKTDIAVFRPSNGTWFLRQNNGGLTAAVFGLETDVPVSADYDGDGKADISVYRPSDGFWYRVNSANNAFAAVRWGTGGDQPIPSAFR